MHSHFVVGIVLGAFFISGTCGTALSMLLPARLRERFGYAALAAGVVITVVAMLVDTLPLYVCGSVLAGLGFGATFRFAVGALAQAAPTAQRGEVFATMYIASYVAFSVPALAAGLAAAQFGLKPTAVVYGALDVALIGIAALLRTRGQVRADSTPAPRDRVNSETSAS